MKYFNGVVNRSLQTALARLQRSKLIPEFSQTDLTVHHLPVACLNPRGFSSRICAQIPSKRLLGKCSSGASQKTFKHSAAKVQTKEADVRNYASSVLDANPILDPNPVLEKSGPEAVVEEEWKTVGPNYSPAAYLSLAKFKLTCFVAMSSMAGYAVAPGAFDLVSLLSCTAGVLLTSASANTINQFFEVPYDSQMSRTMNRPLVKGLVTPQQAVTFAAASGTTGLLVMYLGANPLTAALGLSTVLIYTCLYTPMKRTNVANTWVGSVVGAIPPMMGWVAATGNLGVGAWLMGGLLFAWQFPHFCALSWNLRSDYSRAGYRMMSVVDPDLCRRVSLKYSLGLAGLSVLFPVCGVTGWVTAVGLAPVNACLVHLAYRFYADGDSESSRKLFKFSLLYLPLALGLVMAGKKRGEEKEEEKGVSKGEVDVAVALSE